MPEDKKLIEDEYQIFNATKAEWIACAGVQYRKPFFSRDNTISIHTDMTRLKSHAGFFNRIEACQYIRDLVEKTGHQWQLYNNTLKTFVIP